MCPDISSATGVELDSYFEYTESPVPPQTSVVTQEFVAYLRAKLPEPYRSVFFGNGLQVPSWCDGLEAAIPGDYGAWAQTFMAQAVYNSVSSVRSNLDYEGIKSAVHDFNAKFDGFATDVYIHYLRGRFETKRFAKEDYRRKLLDSRWRSAIAAKQASTGWLNPSWEMYGHWAKFAACGATDGDIAGVYQELTTKEPMIDLTGLTDIAPDTWRSYRSWHEAAIDSGLLRADRTGAAYETKHSESFCQGGSGICRTIESTVTHLYADDYAGLLPWHHDSGGSCFAAGTCIVMADGTLRGIEDIRPGDEVRSLGSVRKVAFVSKPSRRGRSLYAFNDCGVKFTQTHPIVRHGNEREHGLLAICPAVAETHIPTLKAQRLLRLEPGAEVMGYQDEQWIPITVSRITEYPGVMNEETLYDLILEPDGSMLDRYVVSDGRTHFAVCSEIPSLTMYPLATAAFLHMLTSAAPELHESALGRGVTVHHQHVLRTVKRSVSSIFHEASDRAKQVRAESGGLAQPIDIAEAFGMFVSDGEYDEVTGGAVDTFGAHLVDLLPGEIEMGWRIPFALEPDNDYLAISVYEVSVHAPYELDANEVCSLALIADSEIVTVRQSKAPELFQSRFLRHFAGCAYVKGTRHRQVEMSLTCGPAVSWKGTLPIPADYDGSARLERLCSLRNDQNGETALVAVELRGITEAQREEERSALEHWDAEAKLRFAERFGTAVGRIIAQQLNPPLTAFI